MLATLVYLADEAAENFCGKVTLDLAVRHALPVGSAALPRHISLGTVHAVKDFEHYLQLAARVAEKLEPLTVELTVADTVTTPDGKNWLGFHFTMSEQLAQSRELAGTLLRQAGYCLPDPDPIKNGQNLTLLMETIDPARFRVCVQEMPADRYIGKPLRFDHMGVFFYDADTYAASHYYCCRRFLLK